MTVAMLVPDDVAYTKSYKCCIALHTAWPGYRNPNPAYYALLAYNVRCLLLLPPPLPLPPYSDMGQSHNINVAQLLAYHWKAAAYVQMPLCSVGYL